MVVVAEYFVVATVAEAVAVAVEFQRIVAVHLIVVEEIDSLVAY